MPGKETASQNNIILWQKTLTKLYWGGGLAQPCRGSAMVPAANNYRTRIPSFCERKQGPLQLLLANLKPEILSGRNPASSCRSHRERHTGSHLILFQIQPSVPSSLKSSLSKGVGARLFLETSQWLLSANEEVDAQYG